MNNEILLCLFSLALSNVLAQESMSHLRREGVPINVRPDNASDKIRMAQSEAVKKECQPGFLLFGNQCVRNVIVSPTYTCDPEQRLVDKNCTEHVKKTLQCPLSYGVTTGMCFKQKMTHSEVLCPDDFQLLNGDVCSRKLKLPDVKVCPPETRDDGSLCLKQASYPPQYACPDQYTLQENKCVLEQIYDCTPASATTPEISDTVTASKSVNQPFLRNYRENGYGFVSDRPLRHELVTHGKLQVHRYTVFEEPPIVEEFLLNRTCKRTITEAARTLCDDGGQFDGELCFLEKPVPHIVQPAKYKHETIPVIRQCPPTYTLDRNYDGTRCVALDEIPPTYVCPPGYEDVGFQCIKIFGAKRECPVGFKLVAGERCLQTLIQQPIVHYTVKYTCRGKNCDAT